MALHNRGARQERGYRKGRSGVQNRRPTRICGTAAIVAPMLKQPTPNGTPRKKPPAPSVKRTRAVVFHPGCLGGPMGPRLAGARSRFRCGGDLDLAASDEG